MWRYFDFSISEFGVILMLCGAVCIILGLTRRAHAPRVSLLSGLLLLLGGGLMWLLPRLNLSAAALTRLSFLLVGIAFVSVDLVNAYRRRQCTLHHLWHEKKRPQLRLRRLPLPGGRRFLSAAQPGQAVLAGLPRFPLFEAIHPRRELHHLPQSEEPPPLRPVQAAPAGMLLGLRGGPAGGILPWMISPAPAALAAGAGALFRRAGPPRAPLFFCTHTRSHIPFPPPAKPAIRFDSGLLYSV